MLALPKGISSQLPIENNVRRGIGAYYVSELTFADSMKHINISVKEILVNV